MDIGRLHSEDNVLARNDVEIYSELSVPRSNFQGTGSIVNHNKS